MSGGEEERLPEPQRPAGEGTPGGSLPAADAPVSRGGTLILVVGPSGAGKDTLLDIAKAHFQDDPDIQFRRRVITRADQTGERHIVVSEAEFADTLDAGGFFLSWRAHGLQYGITTDIVGDLREGRTVVANVSRQIVAEARRKWPNTQVIYIGASPEVRRERLVARGRESAGNIDERLGRADIFGANEAEWLTRLDNSGALADGVSRFIALIAGAAKLKSEAESAR